MLTHHTLQTQKHPTHGSKPKFHNPSEQAKTHHYKRRQIEANPKPKRNPTPKTQQSTHPQPPTDGLLTTLG